jgi:predicted ATPase/DNA-binding winged helix-turn-helix (wHTH) protein
MMRNNGSQGKDVVSFGPLCLFITERLLEREGIPVRIGSRALDILITLVKRAGEVVSHRDLIDTVWPGVTVDESALRVHIAGLRKALDDGKTATRYITNIPGRGYCFVAPIAAYTNDAQTQNDSLSSKRFNPNLPSRLERMIGRDEAVQTVCEQLMTHRFVSIVAPGGMGKTTVAISVGHMMLSNFDGAVAFVDLGSITDSSLVANTLASTLNLAVQANDLTPALMAELASQKLFLILDSCEHLAEIIAPLAERIYSTAQAVYILATSREALRAEGEYVHRLAPLESPVGNSDLTVAQAMTFPAVQLFLERATASGTQIGLNHDDVTVVADICRSLDGLPLAIELVAGRVNAYGFRGIAKLLNHRLRLQWRGRRAALPRHQTLNAMLDWSYGLLSDIEKLILRRLSIFVGTFSLAAAEDIAADVEYLEIEVSEILAFLIEKSLVATTIGAKGVTYRLLETTRAYALEKLRQSGELDLVAKIHANHFSQVLGLIDTGSPTFRDRESSFKISAYLGNVRAALKWCFSGQGQTSIGVILAAAAAPLFIEASLLSECLQWTREAVSALADTDRETSIEMTLQEALATSLMFTRGNGEDVRIAITRGLKLAETLGDHPYQLRFRAGLMILSTRIGDYRTALHISEESKALALCLEDPSGTIMADWMLGFVQHLSGDQNNSRVNCESGLARAAVFPKIRLTIFGYDNRILAVVALARGLWLRGFPEQALRAAHRALDEGANADRPTTRCMSMVYTTSVFLWCGNYTKAQEIIEMLVAHAERHSLRPYQAVGLGLKGELLVRRGEASAGIAPLYSALKILGEEKHNIQVTSLRIALAEGLTALGQYDAALVTIDKAVEQAEYGGNSFDMPEILRIKGNLLAAMLQSNIEKAEACLINSLHRAQTQTDLSWELRTAMSLARLMTRQGRLDHARSLLTEVYARFTEGFATNDLQEARKELEYMKSSV